MKTDLINLDFKHSSFPRRQESITYCEDWIPACAGMTDSIT